MNRYLEGLKYLNSLTNFETFQKFPNYETRNYHLEEFGLLLEELGSPHERIATVHVAGSKGKGSVSQMMAEILRIAGYRVGLYTSPHLRSVRERIAVNGRIVHPDDFGDLALTLKNAAPPRPKNYRTYFETLTAMAFYYFADVGVDIAIIETGLGGRLDATNVIRPELSVITSLELEHTPVLGDNIASITAEKAGIIKEGAPCVCAPQGEEAATVLKEYAKGKGSPIYFVGEDCVTEFDGTNLDYIGTGFVISDISIGAPGPAQRTNAALTILGLEQLASFDIGSNAVSGGLASARPQARCQLVKGEPDIVVDTAHTESGALNLLAYLNELGNRKRVLVCGLSADKDALSFAETFGPEVDGVIAVAADVPRSMGTGELLGHFVGVNPALETASSVAAGIDMACDISGKTGLVAITGSFYVAGEALTHLLGELI